FAVLQNCGGAIMPDPVEWKQVKRDILDVLAKRCQCAEDRRMTHGMAQARLELAIDVARPSMSPMTRITQNKHAITSPYGSGRAPYGTDVAAAYVIFCLMFTMKVVYKFDNFVPDIGVLR
ncbi:hypothetical protein, partial [Bradyrhizobium sp.]|uniref:hypothetical protein n=1 Tax=Bradyrhizobium sp. TaxID=376 RepID=UPI003C43A43A